MLTKCPSCQREVSSEAAACPQCGHPFKTQKTVGSIDLKDPVHLVGVGVAVLMIVGTVLFILAQLLV